MPSGSNSPPSFIVPNQSNFVHTPESPPPQLYDSDSDDASSTVSTPLYSYDRPHILGNSELYDSVNSTDDIPPPVMTESENNNRINEIKNENNIYDSPKSAHPLLPESPYDSPYSVGLEGVSLNNFDLNGSEEYIYNNDNDDIPPPVMTDSEDIKYMNNFKNKQLPSRAKSVITASQLEEENENNSDGWERTVSMTSVDDIPPPVITDFETKAIHNRVGELKYGGYGFKGQTVPVGPPSNISSPCSAHPFLSESPRNRSDSNSSLVEYSGYMSPRFRSKKPLDIIDYVPPQDVIPCTCGKEGCEILNATVVDDRIVLNSVKLKDYDIVLRNCVKCDCDNPECLGVIRNTVIIKEGDRMVMKYNCVIDPVTTDPHDMKIIENAVICPCGRCNHIYKNSVLCSCDDLRCPGIILNAVPCYCKGANCPGYIENAVPCHCGNQNCRGYIKNAVLCECNNPNCPGYVLNAIPCLCNRPNCPGYISNAIYCKDCKKGICEKENCEGYIENAIECNCKKPKCPGYLIGQHYCIDCIRDNCTRKDCQGHY